MQSEMPSRRAVIIFAGIVAFLVVGAIYGTYLARPNGAGAPTASKTAPPRNSQIIGTGRNDMSVKTYRALAPREPKVLTLLCELSDYYNFEYAGTRDSNYSILMRDRNGDALQGYAPKRSPLGERLEKTLYNSRRWVTVEVRRDSENPGHVTILGIVE